MIQCILIVLLTIPVYGGDISVECIVVFHQFYFHCIAQFIIILFFITF